MNQLFTVKLTDLGEYEVTVAASSVREAECIAKAVLRDEVTQLPAGMRIAAREVQATAELAPDQPVRRFDVPGIYTIEFSIEVPATSAEDAKRHAARIYEQDPCPWDHDVRADNLRWQHAQEVRS
mgnify:CR=1 FL=1